MAKQPTLKIEAVQNAVDTVAFFIPHVKKRDYETNYEAMIAAIKYQLNWPVTPRRISSLTYIHDNKMITAKVGERERLEHTYEIVAIMEASLYIIVTRNAAGEAGPTILVNDKEVAKITDFKPGPKRSQPAADLATTPA